MTEQVHQCAKVARPSPSQEAIHPNEIQWIKIKSNESSTPTPPQESEEPSQTRTDMKENIIAALQGFMSMGIYMCGPSQEDPESLGTEPEDSLLLKTESVHEESRVRCEEAQEEKTGEEKVDTISLDDYIFEDGSTDDGHIGLRVTVHPMSQAKQSYLVPIPEEEHKEQEPTPRLQHDDIFEFSDNETAASSCKREECSEGEQEAEELKEEQYQGDNSLEFYMMEDFEMVPTNFYGTKPFWNVRHISATRFEI